MDLIYIGIISFMIFCAVVTVYRSKSKTKNELKKFDVLENKSLSSYELGLMYERYIGYLFESEGYEVNYNGAINKYADLGRDLIVSSPEEVCIIQTKYWAKFKTISENQIFQLYGSLVHYRRTSFRKNLSAKAIFYTTANYSDTAIEVARILDIELRTEKLKKSYPQIKCVMNRNNEKFYYFPSDSSYDYLKVQNQNGDMFAWTVKEATKNGFRRGKMNSKAS